MIPVQENQSPAELPGSVAPNSALRSQLAAASPVSLTDHELNRSPKKSSKSACAAGAAVIGAIPKAKNAPTALAAPTIRPRYGAAVLPDWLLL
ncbi:hypothetical protein MMIN_09560 [Mycolicibacter minnesotensis]|nr:hypothetical protein MMIN_09560 [Mycolicibacter minnesotensis]